MTGKQDTDNQKRLQRHTNFLAQAREGRLSASPTLSSYKIAILRYPSDDSKQMGWHRQLVHDMEQGKLPKPRNTEHHRFDYGSSCITITGYHISKRDYREYIILQQLFGCPTPADSLEYCWIGEIPSIPLISSAPTLPQGEPDRPESGAAAKRAALAQLLNELDKRAAEKGVGFDRHSLPGTKEEFIQLLEIHCPIFRHIATSTVADYLKGECQFQRGAKPDHGKGAAVWTLFPEYNLK